MSISERILRSLCTLSPCGLLRELGGAGKFRRAPVSTGVRLKEPMPSRARETLGRYNIFPSEDATRGERGHASLGSDAK